MNIGIIGYGYWGPNLLRNFFNTKSINVTHICDLDNKILERALKIYPNLITTNNYNDITNSKDIDAVAIATPVNSHYDIAKNALNKSKHIFIEKPFTSSLKHAEDLIEIAEKKS